jgi:hypothetical protein
MPSDPACTRCGARPAHWKDEHGAVACRDCTSPWARSRAHRRGHTRALNEQIAAERIAVQPMVAWVNG